jgi:hypothetical protein
MSTKDRRKKPLQQGPTVRDEDGLDCYEQGPTVQDEEGLEFQEQDPTVQDEEGLDCHEQGPATCCDSDAAGRAGEKFAAEHKVGRRAYRFTEGRHEADVVEVLKSIQSLGENPNGTLG